MTTYSAKHKAFYERHRERLKAKMRERAAMNRDKYRADSRAYRAANAEKLRAAKSARRSDENFLANERARNKVWREANKERKAMTRAKWMRANPQKVNACVLRRRKALTAATPRWADLGKMAEAYAKATELTALTGVKHQVDHIVPIQSRIVCGLHVPSNLQILTKTQNISKGNRSWPEMPR